jgi:hypothetical protein
MALFGSREMRTTDRLFEYSCHEGNVSLTYILQGARVRDGQWPLRRADD